MIADMPEASDHTVVSVITEGRGGTPRTGGPTVPGKILLPEAQVLGEFFEKFCAKIATRLRSTVRPDLCYPSLAVRP